MIGCGSIGSRHARNLRGLGCASIRLFDVDGDRAASVAAEIGGVAAAGIEEALDAEPGVALVCSPPALHAEHARRALEAGWDLFVEKPVAVTAAEAAALAALAEQCGAVSLVGFNFRFEPGLQRVHRLLRDGDLGRPLAIRAIVGQYLPDWHPWEDYRRGYSARRELGGGVLLDNSHEIDMLIWLFGDPESVWCQGGTVGELGIETEDLAQLSLVLPGPALAQLQLDYLQRSPRRELEIACTNGTIRWRYDERRLELYRPGPGWTVEPLREDHNLTYVDGLTHLLDSVRTRSPTVCDLQEGARSLRVVEAARRAASIR